MSGIPLGAKKLGDGFYETTDGSLHIDLEELIVAAGGDPTSDEDRETALRAVERIAGAEGIPSEVRLKR